MTNAFMPGRFLSYGKQWIDQQDIEHILQVLQSDYLTQGPLVESFEEEIKKATGAKYCVTVANGTAALHLAVAALNLEKGKKGITSPITFAASSNCFLYNGLLPDFADIDDKDYCISPEKLEARITKDTACIIPVHFAGQAARMREISDIARKNNIPVIEDAAHAIGSKYDDGTPVGNCNYSDMAIFSFHPVKTITTGEGGAITTNNEQLYKRLLMLRTHGITKDGNLLEQNPGPWYYEMHDLGFNYRITDIQCALGIGQMKKLEMFCNRRKEIVKKYNEAFSGIDWLVTPFERCKGYSAFHLYVLLIDFSKINLSRKQVMEILKEKKIGTQVHYIPVHYQPYYRKNFGFRQGQYPVAEKYYEQCLSIPLFPSMTDEEVNYVINEIKKLPEYARN